MSEQGRRRYTNLNTYQAVLKGDDSEILMLMRWKQWRIPKDQAGFLRTYTPRETLRRSAVSY